MRKLLLASFKHTNGAETFEEQRLVAINSNPGTSDPVVGCRVFEKWFAETHPESTLDLIVVYPTIDGTSYQQQRPLPAPEYGIYSAYSLTEIPKEYQGQMSRQMVIDMDGNRKNFQLAHYDFDQKEWVFAEDDTSLLEEDHAKWMDILPFADR